MRRTLLSCTSLARNGLIALATAAFAAIAPAHAGDASPLDAISALLDLNRQEFAVLTTALALLGFSVVAAILLMRTRVRAARSEARLRADIGELQVQADRFRALLFAEPQILISWAAGDNRPQITGDISLLMPQELAAAAPPRLRNLAAAGTGAADGPCGRRAARGRRRFSAQSDDLERTLDRGHGPRHRRPGHCTDSRTRRLAPGTGRNEPALQGAVGGNRDAARLRRRGALADLGQERAKGELRYANAAYARATEATSVADAIASQPRTARQRPTATKWTGR